MTTIKVRVKYDSKNEVMKDLLPIGYETELLKEYYEEDHIIPARVVKCKNQNYTIPEKVIPKGSYKRFCFVAANGNVCTDKMIIGMIGYKPLDEIFDKI